MMQDTVNSLDFVIDKLIIGRKWAWFRSLILAVLAIAFETIRSLLNPFWWLSKKINPYSSYTRLPDRLTAFFFRLDIVIQSFSGKPYQPIRNKWIERMKVHSVRNKPKKGKLLPVETFDYRERDWKEFSESLIQEPRPIYLPGFLKNNPAYHEWSLQELVSRFGEEEVLLTCPVYDGYLGPLRDINIPGVYLHNSEILFRKYPALFHQMGMAQLGKLMGKHIVFMGVTQLFAGKKDTGTPWHCADFFNCFLMLEGQKKWTFINPEDSPLLLPMGSGEFAPLYYYSESLKISRVSGHSSEHLLEGDRRKLQEAQRKAILDEQLSFFQSADRYEVILQPGDLLLSPPFWWHEVENITSESIGVATRWFNVSYYQTTNRVFQPWQIYRFKTIMKEIHLMYTQDVFDPMGEIKPIDEVKISSKVEELYTHRIRGGALERYMLPSESVSAYYKRHGIERPYSERTQ